MAHSFPTRRSSDRDHPPSQPLDDLEAAVKEAIARGGMMLVASFAVGRCQQLVYLLRILMASGRLPEVPVWVDSPMAVEATDVFRRHAEEHDFAEAKMAGVAEALASPFVRMAKTAEESKAINAHKGAGIVIASSGMMNGGRILHHLAQRLPDPKTTVLVAGFQAIGTRGRSLIDGAKYLRIHGRDVPVRAAVRRVDALSGHADRHEIGRCQQLVYLLRTLMAAGRIPEVPVWIDSPMAVDAMEVFRRHVAEHDFSEATMAGVAASLAAPFVHMAKTANESKAINAHRGPGIVIASSGMMNGGRILHHLAQRLPDPKTTVLVAGFQAAGTRGRSLIDGAEFLRIHGRDIPVRAAVRRVDALSGHADRREIARWLTGLPAPKRAFLVHGEPPASRGMAELLHTTFGWETTIPAIGETFDLV